MKRSVQLKASTRLIKFCRICTKKTTLKEVRHIVLFRSTTTRSNFLHLKDQPCSDIFMFIHGSNILKAVYHFLTVTASSDSYIALSTYTIQIHLTFAQRFVYHYLPLIITNNLSFFFRINDCFEPLRTVK